MQKSLTAAGRVRFALPMTVKVLRLRNLGMLTLTGCALMRVIYTLFKSFPPRLAYTEFKMLRRAAY